MLHRRGVELFVLCFAFSAQALAQGSDTLEDRARAALSRGETIEALAIFRKSVALRKPEDPSLPDLLDELAELEYRAGLLPNAEQSAARALNIRKRSFGPNHPSVATNMNNLGEVLFAEARFKEAEWYYRGAVELVQRETPPDPERQARFLSNLGKALTERGPDGEAEQVLGRALAIWTRLSNVPEEAATLGMIGVLRQKRREYADAEEMYRRVLDRLPPDQPNAITARINLADVLRLRKRYEESARQFKEALPLVENRLGREHPDRATALTLYASLLRDTGRTAEAKSVFAEAKRIRQTHARTNGTAWVVDARTRR